MSFRACRMHHPGEGMAPHGMPSIKHGSSERIQDRKRPRKKGASTAPRLGFLDVRMREGRKSATLVMFLWTMGGGPANA